MDTVAQKKKNNKCYLSHTVNTRRSSANVRRLWFSRLL